MQPDIRQRRHMPVVRVAGVHLREGLTIDRGLVRALPMILGGYMAGRLIVLVCAVLSETIITRNPALTSGDSGPLLRALTSWDGWFYLGIARDGYHVEALAGSYHDYAFLPLYPVLVRTLSAPFPGAAGAVSILASHLLFAVALVLLFVLGRRHLGDHRAALGCFLLAISPFSVIFSMAYAESLFLVLVLGTFLAAERDQRALAGVLIGLAALTRLPGALLVVPLAIILLRRDGWRPHVNQTWLLLGPSTAAGFLIFVALLTGSPEAYGTNQAGWGRAGLGAAGPGATMGAALGPLQLILLTTLCASLFLLVYARVDGVRPEYTLVPILFLGATFASGDLESVGRYATVAFPLFWLMAGRRGAAWRWVWPLLSAGLLAAFALLSFSGDWVP